MSTSIVSNLDTIEKNSTRVAFTIAFLVSALALNGDWLLLIVHSLKYQGLISNISIKNDTVDDVLQYLKLQNLSQFWISTMVTSFGFYYTIGFYLHWKYYVKGKDHPQTWKCQPKRFLPRELELDEIKVGSQSLFIVNTWSAILACYVYNGGYCSVYYTWDEYGIFWSIAQVPLVFVYQDYLTYWLHRIFHFPYLYKRFHKIHHKYEQPTAFSVVAIHPFEISLIQAILILPMFTVPVHWMTIHCIAVYFYYHGLISHSGINFMAYWWQPWQPDAIFHDNHHQYYHVNFGFNCILWDKLHGTYRQSDRVYNEQIFYGKGKPLSDIGDRDLD